MASTSSLTIEDLDSDVLLIIFSYIDIIDRHRYRIVCKTWNKVLKYSIAKQRSLKFCQKVKGMRDGSSDTIAIGYFTSMAFLENSLKYSSLANSIEFLYTNGNYLSLEKSLIFECIAKNCKSVEKFLLKFMPNRMSGTFWSLYGNDVLSLAANLVNLKVIDIEIRSSVNGNHLVPLAKLPHLKWLRISTLDDHSSLRVSEPCFAEHFASSEFESFNITSCANFDHNLVIQLMNDCAKKSIKQFILNKISFSTFLQMLSEFKSLSLIDVCINAIDNYDCDYSKSYQQFNNLKTLEYLTLNNTSGEVFRFDSTLLLILESNLKLKSINFYNLYLTDESLSRIKELCPHLISLKIGMREHSLELNSDTWRSISMLTQLKILLLKHVTGFSAEHILALIKNCHLNQLHISDSGSDQSLRTEIFNEIKNNRLTYANNSNLKISIDRQSIKI